ncbi:MAG: addiction module protein, partial [Deltaproteobacteria bacterium]|nr:addiction module protein [Deltaproteobacteria bacterium]
MLWDDICRNVPDFSSPAWHENILKEREQKLR